MDYNELIRILLLNDVYEKLKQNEPLIFNLIPELKACKGFNQNSKWHIYDVYEHILHAISETHINAPLRLAALFHDIGKPLTYTVDDDGEGHFYNHWSKSVEIFYKYKDRFGLSEEEISLVTNLIFYHDINIEKMNDNELYDMITSFGITNIKLLFELKRADLLAQAAEFHNLLSNINNQEQKVIKLKNSTLK